MRRAFPSQGRRRRRHPSPALEPAAESANRSRLLLLGGVAASSLLAVLAYFLFFAGGDADEPAADAAARRRGAVPSRADAGRAARSRAAAGARTPSLRPRPVQGADRRGASRRGGHRRLAGRPTGRPADHRRPSTGTPERRARTEHRHARAGRDVVAHASGSSSVAPDNSTITVKVDGKRYADLAPARSSPPTSRCVVIGGKTNALPVRRRAVQRPAGPSELTIA